MAISRRHARSKHELGVSPPGPRTGQRVGWTLLLLVIIAAVAGAFGDGPLSRASLSSPGGLRVDYDRIVRRRAPTEIRVVVPSAPMPSGVLALAVDGLSKGERLVPFPTPQHERATVQGARFEIATRGEGPFEVALRNVPSTLGRREIRLAIGLAEPIAVRQLVLP